MFSVTGGVASGGFFEGGKAYAPTTHPDPGTGQCPGRGWRRISGVRNGHDSDSEPVLDFGYDSDDLPQWDSSQLLCDD